MTELKIVADFKRQTQQRGSIKTAAVVVLAIAAILAGVVAQRFVGEPEVTFQTVGGDVMNWQSEKWTVINYFAEWCTPCLRELPELNAYYQNGEARLLGVSYDNLSAEALKAMIERQQIRFPVVASEDVSNLPVPMPSVLPTTYIISPDGKLVKTLHGEQTEQGLTTLLLSL